MGFAQAQLSRMPSSTLVLIVACIGAAAALPATSETQWTQTSHGLSTWARACMHSVDTADHKCFEACADHTFAMKGIKTPGPCPPEYNTVDVAHHEEQCPDGITNLRYCQGTAVNVTITTKGEAGMAMAQVAAGGMKCPGSSAWVHAETQLAVTFTDSCDVVKAEVEARIKGSADGSWTDPHNGGKYTITSGAGTNELGFSRTTGGAGKYTDKVIFTFSDSQEGGCSLNACSESQVTSVLDMSTNYCNSHDLFCGDAGCHVIKSKLTYTENVVRCKSGQHSKSDCYKK